MRLDNPVCVCAFVQLSAESDFAGRNTELGKSSCIRAKTCFAMVHQYHNFALDFNQSPTLGNFDAKAELMAHLALRAARIDFAT